MSTERNRRANLTQEASFAIRGHYFFKKGSWEKAVSFAADVWAASVLIDADLGRGAATPTRIAKKLSAMGRTHGYSNQSLRKMVYRARPRIDLLEEAILPTTGKPCWPPFEIKFDCL